MKKVRIILAAALVVVLTILIVAVVIHKQPVTQAVHRPTYTQKQGEEFLESTITPLIKQLRNGSYPTPELQNRYKDREKVIVERYQKIVTVYVVGDELIKNELATTIAAPAIVDGVPNLQIFVKALWNTWEEFKTTNTYRRPDAQQIFNDYFVACLLHEIEHFSGETSMLDRSPENSLRGELEAWGKTCEFALAPLVEKYNRPIHPSFLTFYNAWVKGGRQQQSVELEALIRRVYSHIKVK